MMMIIIMIVLILMYIWDLLKQYLGGLHVKVVKR